MHSEHHERGTRSSRERSDLEPIAVAHAAERAHPEPRQYLVIAAILTVITAIEVGIYYVGALQSVLTPVLLALSASKFALVALFYMHLKFDSPTFARLFLLGLGIAVAILLALLALFSHRGV